MIGTKYADRIVKTNLMIKSLLDYFGRSDRRELTEQEIKLMIGAHIFDGEPINFSDPASNFKDTDTQQILDGFNIFCLKLKFNAPATRVTKGVAFFIITQVQNPAMAVMWAYTIHRLYLIDDLVNMESFTQAFPWGIPTQETMRIAWRDQKLEGGGNALDQKETWDEHLESILGNLVTAAQVATVNPTPANIGAVLTRRFDFDPN